MIHRFETTIGGQTLTIETGRLAEQAGGAVTVQYGETVVLVTACVSKEPRVGADFLPLTVDFEERLYAAGKIPGGFFKREGRPSQDAILTCRLTDRAIRPLFPKDFRHEIQVITTTLSADQENDPDVLSLVGASAAVLLSEIPFEGPVGAVKVGCIDGEIVLNPTYSQLEHSTLEMVVAGTREAIIMVEAGASQISEETVLKALRVGQEANLKIVEIQEEMARLLAKPKMVYHPPEPDHELETKVRSLLDGRLSSVLYLEEKASREEALEGLKQEVLSQVGEGYDPQAAANLFEEAVREELRSNILTKGVRPDGRAPSDIRPITCEVGFLPRTHGSGLFTRGQTQVMTIATLGSLGEEQRLDTLSPEESKRFLHHYNFPPYSTGETRRLGTPPRRSIGHGALAERALLPVIPGEEEFPYTIRLVSEVLSSNGSTSMASVCASSLALMDAGVPIQAPVAGIAMGLIMGQDGKFAILTDIQGIEDALGDMDFKVAGTAEGITALQMDIKVKGISEAILEKALGEARVARLLILEKMMDTISSARPELSKYAPRMYKIRINPEKIRNVIGPGGKTIRSIISQTKCTIDVEDDGTIIIGTPDPMAADKAIKIIEGLTKEVEVGAIYTGRVTRITNFGAFVEILPGKEGLVRINELADYRVPRVEEAVKIGDEIMVMVTEIDRMGRINLSRRAVLLGQTLEQVRKGAVAPGAKRGNEPHLRPLRDRERHQGPQRGPARPSMGGRRPR
jgi:polyribonucleotide nucleotidyltransferase